MDHAHNTSINNGSRDGDTLYQLILNIQEYTEFDHEIEQFRLIETHISYVLLTGPYAYKFKKTVNLGFLDFHTIDMRKHFCEEEIRLNKRLAPGLYIDVVCFTGDPDRPVLNGAGPVLEYAVRMEQFAEDEQALILLRDGKLTNQHIEQLARQLAEFHETIAVCGSDSEYGEPQLVLQDAMDNFNTLRPLLTGNTQYSNILNELASWTIDTFNKTRQLFARRKQEGFIRECHGDVHLGNIVQHRNEMLIFDCIEFSPALHWIDVINDLAFLIMDLHEHDKPDMAQHLLNDYLQRTGDYTGLYMLRFYLVYRALVRSKVAGIRLAQSHIDLYDIKRETGAEHRYLDLAWAYTRSAEPVLLITHGVSGCGKSTLSRELADKTGAIWIRSDVERKRLHGLGPQEKSFSGMRTGIYTPESTDRTYGRLAAACRIILDAGYPVIVDATFLQRHARKTFYKIAHDFNSAVIILDFQADEAILKARIIQRIEQGLDASEADLQVLSDQFQHQDPLDEMETHLSIKLDAATATPMDQLVQAISVRKKENIDASFTDLETGLI